MQYFSFFALLFSFNAFAINVKDCPAQLTVSFSDLTVSVPQDQLLSKLGRLNELEAIEVSALQDTYRVLDANFSSESVLKLTRANAGRCVYRGADHDVKAEIYTRLGVDTFFIQNHAGPRGIMVRVYAKLAELSPVQLSLKAGDSRFALAIPRYPYRSYSAGGALEFVGTASQIQVKAE